MINTYYVSLQKNNLALLFQSGLPIIAPCFKMPMAKKECNICKTQVVALPRHMKQIHMQNTHTADCNHCGKLFSSNRVKEHIRSVHGPATFGCNFCDKMFTTNFKLTSHKKYIHTERNYQLPKKLPMRCVCKTVKQPKCTQCAQINPQY